MLDWSSSRLNYFRGRRARVLILVGLLAVFFVSLVTRNFGRQYYDLYTTPSRTEEPKRYPGPPTYEKLRKWEDSLPQNDLSLPLPEGKGGRYVRFMNQIRLLGWNNALGDVLMNAHLAYSSNRAYVFQEYYWEPKHYPWPQSQHLTRYPTTPFTALLAGPIAGAPFPSFYSQHPRSVPSSWFDVVCPPSVRRIIYTNDVKEQVQWSEGADIFAAWQKILTDAPEGCIEVISSPGEQYPQTIDLWVWGSSRVLSLWSSFSRSPIASTLLAASPIVRGALERNAYLFLPTAPRPYDQMLAMHVRRGDYSSACEHLAKWNSTFYSWNLLPFLHDRFSPPAGQRHTEMGENTPENIAVFLSRCLPSSPEIVEKAKSVKRDYLAATPNAKLDVVYLMTNEPRGSTWLNSLASALKQDGWRTIITSNDMDLEFDSTGESLDVGMAVDMEIARKAAVFVGNGWSSFTSNIVHRRLVDGRDPVSVRFF